jgi:hypothetical protein
VVPDATVTARNTSTSLPRAGASNENGAYLITNLPVGPYALSIEKAGFRPFTQDGITLQVNQNARRDAVLVVGDVTDTVTISAAAINVDTRESAVGDVVDRARVQELPLNGRNVMQLAQIIPGVSTVSAPTLETRGREGPAVGVAGGRATQNEIRFDGSSHVALYHNSILNLPSPDALQEFKVFTSNFSAEYGRYGGGVFIAVTRAGTNQFHGSLWEYLRNKALNARNFFSVDKPDLKQNQFGFTFGGPVIRNRTFFFASHQGTRVNPSRLLSSATPPTAAERAGDFSASSKKPVDPVARLPFPDGKIPQNLFDTAAVGLLSAYVPLPNTTSGHGTADPPSADAQEYARAEARREIISLPTGDWQCSYWVRIWQRANQPSLYPTSFAPAPPTGATLSGRPPLSPSLRRGTSFRGRGSSGSATRIDSRRKSSRSPC